MATIPIFFIALADHNYTGPYNPLGKTTKKYDPDNGEVLIIYLQSTGKTDAFARRHDINYAVCQKKEAMLRGAKNKPDRKLVQPLDVVNYKDRSDGMPRAQCDIPQTKSGALDSD